MMMVFYSYFLVHYLRVFYLRFSYDISGLFYDTFYLRTSFLFSVRGRFVWRGFVVDGSCSFVGGFIKTVVDFYFSFRAVVVVALI